MADITYSPVSVNYHDGTSNNTRHYLCEKLDFNTGILWRCDDYKITKQRVIPDNVDSMSPYPTPGKKEKL